MLGATAGYRYIGAESNMFEPVTNNPTVIKEDFHYLFSSLNFTYFLRFSISVPYIVPA